ncbi:MAG: cysteine--tRNA ligase, partial [Gammaproteobacteria bacterium]|nr:cysteine--tRNA ligase [Gammaproteobacteria bacterium]
FFTIREVLKKYDPEVVRYLLISSHYRSPINYSDDNLQQSACSLERLYVSLKDMDTGSAKLLANSRFEKAYTAAMDDDFNTPEAISVLFDLAREINKEKAENPEYACQLGALMIHLGSNLGILGSSPADFLHSSVGNDVEPQYIEELLVQRRLARDNKDWARADAIRDELSALKVVVEDSAEGSSWRIER